MSRRFVPTKWKIKTGKHLFNLLSAEYDEGWKKFKKSTSMCSDDISFARMQKTVVRIVERNESRSSSHEDPYENRTTTLFVGDVDVHIPWYHLKHSVHLIHFPPLLSPRHLSEAWKRKYSPNFVLWTKLDTKPFSNDCRFSIHVAKQDPVTEETRNRQSIYATHKHKLTIRSHCTLYEKNKR